MATEIRVPTLGESVTEATIGKWFKAAGDPIAVDEPLVELETDKVTIEVPAPFAGTLAEIAVKEGETVEVGALLGSITEGGGKAAPAKKAEPAKPVEEKSQAAVPAPASSTGEAAAKTAKIAGQEPIEARTMPPAPSAAKMMAEKNVSAGQVEGSGKRGQILKADVLEALSKGAASQPAEAPRAARAPSPADDQAREERVRMTKLRQIIARRTKYKDIFEKKHGVKLGFMGFFTKAVTHALKEIPNVNAEIDGTDII